MQSYLADFNEISAVQVERDRAQTVDDLNNEAAGLEVGRISKFLTRGDENGLTGNKRGQNTGHVLSALDIMLATSPEYFALHSDLSGDLRNAQDRNHDLDQRLDTAIDAARSDLSSIIDQAALLPNGERAYLDGDGIAWTADDSRVDPAITEGIDWTGRPQRTTYLDARDALTDLQDAQDENRRIGVRLGDINNSAHDDDNPPAMDEMQELHAEVEAIERQMDHLMDAISPSEINDRELAAPVTTINIALPTLGD